MNSEDRNKLKQEHDRALLKSVDYLAVKELNVANKLYAPRFHSQHEGYALLLEEIEEATAALDQVHSLATEIIWPSYIKRNRDIPSTLIKDLEGEALHAVQECIQVLAMAKKWRASFLAVPEEKASRKIQDDGPTLTAISCEADIPHDLPPQIKKAMKDLLASLAD